MCLGGREFCIHLVSSSINHPHIAWLRGVSGPFVYLLVHHAQGGLYVVGGLSVGHVQSCVSGACVIVVVLGVKGGEGGDSWIGSEEKNREREATRA